MSVVFKFPHHRYLFETEMREQIYSERARLMFLLPRARRGKKKSKVFVSFTENIVYFTLM